MTLPDFVAIAHKLESAKEISMLIDPKVLYVLVGQIQLALRHPGNWGPSSEVAREAAIEFQKSLGELDPEISIALEHGWHPEFDTEPQTLDSHVPTLLNTQQLKRYVDRRRAALVAAGCATYNLGRCKGRRAILCLCCGLTSFNPNDIASKYCGFCHAWHNEWTEEDDRP